MEADHVKGLIDVERVIVSKNPALLKILHGFIITWLKRIIHKDRVNEYIRKHADVTGLPFVEAILKEFGVRIEVEIDERRGTTPFAEASEVIKGEERWTKDGVDERMNLRQLFDQKRCIVVANHPLGGLDGMALMHVIGKVRSDIVFPVNDLLMNVPGLKPLFIPINKHGSNIENVQLINATFASEKVILYFPAGLVSRKQKGGIITDLEWKKTFITKARQYQRDIIPVYIKGRNSDRFYNFARWRKRLRIKANIEMIFLVDEMMKQKDKTIRLIFGSPIPWSTFTRAKNDHEWAKFVRGQVYHLSGY